MQSRNGDVLTWVDPIVRDAQGRPSFGEGMELAEVGGRFARIFG
jgi:hypothetical protein